jgi:adenosylcobinamide kinase / adenosylcobinamide-phosphate guanylyltransferase
MKQITLITGGGRSGKSEYALKLAKKYGKKAFIATAQAFDIEMKERISRHKRNRDSSFHLIEEPIELIVALKSLPKETELAIIDCITVWIGNCLYKQESDKKEIFNFQNFIESLKDPPCDLIIVTNEVGMGIIPDNELSRKYRDVIGTINCKIADVAQQVILMVSGIPVTLKGRKQL